MTSAWHSSLDPYLLLADAVIVTDKDHRILAVNHAYEVVTGYESEEILGKKAGILRTPLTPAETYDSMRAAIHHGLPWMGVFTNRKKSNDLWHSSISITPFAIEGNTYYVGVFRELEQLERGYYLAEERVGNIQESLLKVLAISCEIRDPGIEGHLLRVRQITAQLVAKHNERMRLRISDVRLHHIAYSSILHDIGKSAIPEGILYKPGPLTDYERKIVEMHPLIGVDILEKINSDFDHDLVIKEMDTARNIILYHHEKWDGTGYPEQLSGLQIPFEARIVSLVDVYDAVTSRRSYKERWSAEEAVDYIREQKGKHFDPDIVDSFLELLLEQKFI